jgi:hypothetical protein
MINMCNGRINILTILLALMAIGTNEARAELIVNGGFETGDLTGWTWTKDVNSEPTMVATVASFNGSNAFEVNPGNNSGAIGGPDLGGTLSQSVPLVAGETYRVFGLLAIQNVGTARNADGGTITALLGGTTLHTFDVQGINLGITLEQSFAVLYTSSSTGSVPFELRFTRNFRNNGPNVLHYADDLSIRTIPEPPSLVLMGVGVLGMLGLCRAGRRSLRVGGGAR